MVSKLRERAKQATKGGGETPPSINHNNSGNLDNMISTGSTLLDLAISGTVTRYGGVPTGILMELYGSPGAGKTAILSEMAGNAIRAGGTSAILDPEGRMDKKYATIFGLDLDNNVDYSMPNTVTDIFEFIEQWEPESVDSNMIMVDSLAALSTKMEMEDEDAMGMRRAKEFSQGLRKVCRQIKNKNWLIACTNQVRVNLQSGGETTPGGMGIPFYSSLRIRIALAYRNRFLKKTATINGVKQEKIYGVKSECTIKKSSIDTPYRSAFIYFIFDYGIDDVRANLEFLKDNTEVNGYEIDGKVYKTINKAIEVIETKELEDDLKERTVTLWHQIQDALLIQRKTKKRI